MLRRFVDGGMGTTSAVLLPRVWSVMTQWLVAAVAGTAALTAYITTTTRGSAAVSLVANALAPVLILRRGAMRTEGGRALIGAALGLLALAAFTLAVVFEAALGLGIEQGVFTAAFAASTILATPNVATWPQWQARGRFLRLFGVMLVVLLAATGFALIGQARVSAIVVTLGAATPTLAMMGRARLSRAARYAISIARRALPISSMSFATALVYPMSLQLGTRLFGATEVGQQLLFWPVVLALGIASQSLAARALTGAATDLDRADALRQWVPRAAALTVVAAVAYAGFAWQLTPAGGESPLPLGMIVAAASFIFSDSICAYFCPPTGWRLVAIGSVASALVVGASVLAWPRFIIEHVSVCGPPAMVAALRLAFVTHPGLRGRARIVLAVLVIGYVAAATMR